MVEYMVIYVDMDKIAMFTENEDLCAILLKPFEMGKSHIIRSHLFVTFCLFFFRLHSIVAVLCCFIAINQLSSQ